MTTATQHNGWTDTDNNQLIRKVTYLAYQSASQRLHNLRLHVQTGHCVWDRQTLTNKWTNPSSHFKIQTNNLCFLTVNWYRIQIAGSMFVPHFTTVISLGCIVMYCARLTKNGLLKVNLKLFNCVVQFFLIHQVHFYMF